MSQVIWKFPLFVTDAQTVTIPEGAKFLTIQLQANLPFLWAIVNPSEPMIDVEIRIHGTGHELPADSDRYEYIDTFQIRSADLVFHAFRVTNR